MKQCKNCIFYDAEMEALRQSGDDVIIVGHENDEEKNYCSAYMDRQKQPKIGVLAN